MENQETFKCHACNKEFEPSRWELHFLPIQNLKEQEEINKSSLVHEENIKNMCKICEKSFSSKQYLNRHIKSVHEGIKDHKCDLCEKSFSTKQYLNTHMKSVHEGIKDHKCELCER